MAAGWTTRSRRTGTLRGLLGTAATALLTTETHGWAASTGSRALQDGPALGRTCLLTAAASTLATRPGRLAGRTTLGFCEALRPFPCRSTPKRLLTKVSTPTLAARATRPTGALWAHPLNIRLHIQCTTRKWRSHATTTICLRLRRNTWGRREGGDTERTGSGSTARGIREARTTRRSWMGGHWEGRMPITPTQCISSKFRVRTELVNMTTTNSAAPTRGAAPIRRSSVLTRTEKIRATTCALGGAPTTGITRTTCTETQIRIQARHAKVSHFTRMTTHMRAVR